MLLLLGGTILDTQSVILASLLNRQTNCINRWLVIRSLRVWELVSRLHVIQARTFFFLSFFTMGLNNNTGGKNVFCSEQMCVEWLDVSSQDATVYWGPRCWHNAGLQSAIFFFLNFSSSHMDPVILHTAKCTPPPPPTLPHCTSLSPVSLFPPYIFLKLHPYVWGDPRFKHAPQGTTPLSPIDLKP